MTLKSVFISNLRMSNLDNKFDQNVKQTEQGCHPILAVFKPCLADQEQFSGFFELARPQRVKIYAAFDRNAAIAPAIPGN